MSTKKLASRLNRFGASATGVVHNKVNELKRAGQTILSLNVGEPDFDTPETAKEAAVAAIEEGFTKYTSTNGCAELREAIAAAGINLRQAAELCDIPYRTMQDWRAGRHAPSNLVKTTILSMIRNNNR